MKNIFNLIIYVGIIFLLIQLCNNMTKSAKEAKEVKVDKVEVKVEAKEVEVKVEEVKVEEVKVDKAEVTPLIHPENTHNPKTVPIVYKATKQCCIC